MSFTKDLKKLNRKELNNKLFPLQSKIAKEERLPKIKKDFTVLLSLKNQEHLIKTEIRVRQIKEGRKSIRKLEIEAKEEKDRILRKKLR